MMPVDLRGKKFVSLCPVLDSLYGEECREAFLPKIELALDLTFRLRVFGYEVTDTEAAEGALELREGIGVASFARFVAEEAQAIGIEGVGKAVGEENFPDMGKVGECGFGLDKASSDDETGGIVDSQGEDLELFSGPPLVRRTVVLE